MRTLRAIEITVLCPTPVAGTRAAPDSVTGTTPAGAALTNQCTETLRGAAYLPFDGDLPVEHAHSKVAMSESLERFREMADLVADVLPDALLILSPTFATSKDA